MKYLLLIALLGCSPVRASIPHPTEITAYGDSITAGGNGSSDFTNGYAFLIAKYFGATLVNRAMGGSRLFTPTPGEIGSEQITRILEDGSERPSGSLNIFLTGFNDAFINGEDTAHLLQYQTVLSQAIDHLTQNGQTLLLGNCLRIKESTALSDFGVSRDRATAMYNASIQQDVLQAQAQGKRVYLVDTASVFDPEVDTWSDGVHPSDGGHIKLANAFLEYFQ